MTPQELKNSILQFAIQGKLVEQRHEEGTAEELYKQIQAEKQALIKAGKIKKEKPLPEITEDEIPFETPESWKWVRTGNIGSWSAGATPSRTNAEYYNGNIPWLKTGDLNDGVVIEAPESISPLALEKTSVRLNPVGSVLMAMYGATIGKLAILGTPMTTNQACCACIPYGGMFNKYLFYFLMGMRKAFIKMGEGGAQPNISKDKIVNSLIPLPPLAEQKRIVAKIEELLPLIERYEKAWSRLEDFNKRFPGDMQKSILQMAIQGKLVEQHLEEGTGEELYRRIQAEKQALIKAGKIKKEKPLPEIAEDEIPFEIPGTWRWIKLGEISAVITKGTTPRGGNVSYLDSGIGFLRAENVAGLDNLDKSNLKYIDENTHKGFLKRSILEANDILITIAGTLGRTAIVRDYDLPLNANQAIALVRLVSVSDVILKYLVYALNSAGIQTYLTGQRKITAIPNLTLEIIDNCMIPLPPLVEQNRIVARLEELLPLCERLK